MRRCEGAGCARAGRRGTMPGSLLSPLRRPRRSAMSARQSRRRFLQTAAAGSLLGAADLSLLAGLRPVGAADARIDPKLVRLQPDIEPLVRLIEETPRGELLEDVATRVRHGLSYQNLLAALMLA